MTFITGTGDDTITLGGPKNTIDAVGGNNTIAVSGYLNTIELPTAHQGFDTIAEFTETNGDLLDMRLALSVTIDSGGNTDISIMPHGSGIGVGIAQLTGVTAPRDDRGTYATRRPARALGNWVIALSISRESASAERPSAIT